MAVLEVTHFFEKNRELFEIEIAQSDSPSVPGAIHHGHITIDFRPETNTDRISKILQQLPGIERTEGFATTQLSFSIGRRFNALDVAKKIGDALVSEEYMTQAEFVTFCRKIDQASRSQGSNGPQI